MLRNKKKLNSFNLMARFIAKNKIGLINHKTNKKSVHRFFIETNRFLRFKRKYNFNY